MKPIWRVIIILIVSGLIISMSGFFMGASRNGVYWENGGFHLINNSDAKITESDLESFKSINVDTRYCNVEFIPSNKFGIQTYGYEGQWDWSITDETLRITSKEETGKSYFTLGIIQTTSDITYIKIYFPQEEAFKTVSIKMNSGDANIGGFKASRVQIENSYGNVDLYGITSDILKLDLNSVRFTGKDLNAQNIIYKNSYGKDNFENIEAGKFSVNGNSCDFELRSCRVGDIDIENSYGKIIADSLTSSETSIHANSVGIDLNGDFSGKTTIRSSYGDIKFATSKEKEYYAYDISVSYGEIIFDNDRLESDTKIKSGGISENAMEIDASSGNVEVYFAQ